MTDKRSELTIRILLPHHLRTLANITGELQLNVPAPITIASILNQLESQYPMLKGTLRDHTTHKRRDFIRFFACEQDLSNDDPSAPLPEPITSGKQPFHIVGAIAGG